MKATLKFLGGVANDITGSCALLVVKDGKKTAKILIDSGLIQCSFTESLERNKEILKQVNPGELDYIVLTHSHIDHIGRLPLFAKHGFKGRVICTIGTRGLLIPMLEDSAKIQILEANYYNQKAAKAKKASNGKKSDMRSRMTLGNYDRVKRKESGQKTHGHYSPLYTIKDVERASDLIKNGGYEYHQWIRLTSNISLKFYPSGHVMGGAVAVMRINSEPKDVYLGFTGDLGRRDGIILPPPELMVEPLDHLVLESTYGGRVHPERDQEIGKLLDIIRQSVINQQRIIIPSFALERSQEIIYLLSYYMEQGEIPPIPIYLDSPLAEKITAIFSEGWEHGMFADQSRLDFNPFSPSENPYFQITMEQKDSDTLITKTGNYIVIAGSGMCDAGRVRGHLRANLGKSDTIVCLVGYMAENSLGGRLKAGMPIKMNDQEIEVNAQIISFDSFSAHADGPFLVDYAKGVLANSPINDSLSLFIVHGEGESARNLKKDLEIALPKNSAKLNIPILNEEYLI